MFIIAVIADFLNKLFRLPSDAKEARILFSEMQRLETAMAYKKLAVDTCVDIIAGAVLACEFKEFAEGKEIRADAYYKFNVKPNENESASFFLKRIMSKLLKKNECLVIKVKDNYLIADDFNVKPYALYKNIYGDITVGTLTLRESFESSERLSF